MFFSLTGQKQRNDGDSPPQRARLLPTRVPTTHDSLAGDTSFDQTWFPVARSGTAEPVLCYPVETELRKAAELLLRPSICSGQAGFVHPAVIRLRGRKILPLLYQR